MANKKQQFRDFLDKMEWEGGLLEVIDYGLLNTGDEELDGILLELSGFVENARDRISELRDKYGFEEE